MNTRLTYDAIITALYDARDELLTQCEEAARADRPKLMLELARALDDLGMTTSSIYRAYAADELDSIKGGG